MSTESELLISNTSQTKCCTQCVSAHARLLQTKLDQWQWNMPGLLCFNLFLLSWYCSLPFTGWVSRVTVQVCSGFKMHLKFWWWQAARSPSWSDLKLPLCSAQLVSQTTKVTGGVTPHTAASCETSLPQRDRQQGQMESNLNLQMNLGALQNKTPAKKTFLLAETQKDVFYV